MDKCARLTWRILNVSAKEADLYIYDVIGDPWGEGPSSSEFVQELHALAVDRINLHINSPGGIVSDALAMYNALLNHPAEIVGYVEGRADSAASFVFQAADRRVIAKNAAMFIHEAQGLAFGGPKMARALADVLDEESRNIAGIYADRAGGTVDSWLAAMAAEPLDGTQYRGQEAVDAGLADEVAAAPARTRAYAGRVAAQAAASTPEPTSTPAVDLAAALSAARLEPPAPTLQQLLEAYQTEPLSAALGKGA